mmetsp:Transcript_120974/g.213996  ORF Transcript_120974/g.213996 Transcript_120974/m.213996 type:complete len:184 (-) Transcript_120974:26-577(-)
MSEQLDTLAVLHVVVDLPSLEEESNRVVQLDVCIEDCCLKIVNASQACETTFSPVNQGSDFTLRIAEAEQLMGWLASIHSQLTFNHVQLPVCRRFGKVEVKGSTSTLSYCAYLDVLFPEDWSPLNHVVSFRFSPIGIGLSRGRHQKQYGKRIRRSWPHGGSGKRSRPTILRMACEPERLLLGR